MGQRRAHKKLRKVARPLGEGARGGIMNEWSLVLIIVIPVALIVGMYRLLAHITSHRSTRHGIKPPSEEDRQKSRVFHDD